MTGSTTPIWPIVKLGEVGDALIGLTYDPQSVRRSGVLVLRSSNVQDERLALDDNVYVDCAIPPRIRVRDGDILICVRNGSRRLIGKSAVLDQRVVGQTFGAFMCVFRSPLNSYLRYFFQSNDFKRQIDEHLGATINQITNGSLKSFSVALPDEVERMAIVEPLNDADELIAMLNRLIAKKRAIRQGMMQALLAGRTRLPGFGAPWKTHRLLDLVSIRNGQVDPRNLEYRDLPLIAPDHVESATGRLLKVESAKTQGAISGKYLADPGDIIYSKIRPYLQKVVRVGFPALCSADMYPLTPKNHTDGEFMLHTLLSESFTNFVTSVSVRSGIPKVNRSELAEFTLKVPDISEQQAISAVLNQAGAQILSLEKLLAKNKVIKQGMMQQLLTGHTRLTLAEVAG